MHWECRVYGSFERSLRTYGVLNLNDWFGFHQLAQIVKGNRKHLPLMKNGAIQDNGRQNTLNIKPQQPIRNIYEDNFPISIWLVLHFEVHTKRPVLISDKKT